MKKGFFKTTHASAYDVCFFEKGFINSLAFLKQKKLKTCLIMCVFLNCFKNQKQKSDFKN